MRTFLFIKGILNKQKWRYFVRLLNALITAHANLNLRDIHGNTAYGFGKKRNK